MQTAYIYSVSRVQALTEYLLSYTDIERLFVATPGADLQNALKETYLAPYVTRVDGDVPAAIEQTLIDAKKLIHRIAPNGDMFRVLWVQYDIHNLRAFAKAAGKGLEYDSFAHHLSRRGIYEPQDLYTHAQAGTLHLLQPGWQAAYDKAVQLAAAGAYDQIDAVMDEAVFASARRVAEQSEDDFIKKYFAVTVDFYNFKRILRQSAVSGGLTIAPFIAGGTIPADVLSDLERTFARLQADFGPATHWEAAIAAYKETGNTTQLVARIDEYMVLMAKTASADALSSASLVLYYLLCRQSAANIRTIVVGKNSGMKEEEIRANLRLAYVNN